MNILGEGIDAIDKESLLSEIQSSDVNSIVNIDVGSIVIGKYQPRTGEISDDSLSELRQSIMEQGVLQPILVRKGEKGNYELIAGERRYRASRLAGIGTIPCIVKKITPKQAFAIAIVENIQRKQLTLLEEAEALLRLKLEYGFTNEETARSIARPRTTITNLIRLAEKLSPFGKNLLTTGVAEFGHVRAVLSMSYEEQDGLLNKLLDKRISVRAFEKLISLDANTETLKCPPVSSDISRLYSEVDQITSDFFRRNVKVKKKKNGGIQVVAEFKDEMELHAFLKGRQVCVKLDNKC